MKVLAVVLIVAMIFIAAAVFGNYIFRQLKG